MMFVSAVPVAFYSSHTQWLPARKILEPQVSILSSEHGSATMKVVVKNLVAIHGVPHEGLERPAILFLAGRVLICQRILFPSGREC